MNFDSPALKLGGDQVGGALLGESELGVRMDVMADVGQFLVEGANALHRGVEFEGCIHRFLLEAQCAATARSKRRRGSTA